MVSKNRQVRRGNCLLVVVLGLFYAVFAYASGGYEREGWIADIPKGIHDSQAVVTILDEKTILVEHFTYDGTAPAVYFYLGASDSSVDFANGLQIEPLLDRAYSDETLLLTLPAGYTLDGYHAISVWCALASVNFSSASFEAPVNEVVPALSWWGILSMFSVLFAISVMSFRRSALVE